MSTRAISISLESLSIETIAKARRIGRGNIESGIVSSLCEGLTNLTKANRKRDGFVKPRKEATNERA